MYKRRREGGDPENPRHNGIKEEGHVESDSDQSGLAGDRMREPRMYECQFCKRGFSSAQALGGHMNVHRRDRAMGKAAFHGSAASNHRNNNNNNNNSSNSNNHVSILQPHGQNGKPRTSFFLGLTSLYVPYDQDSTVAAASSQPSSFVLHGDTRDNIEDNRPELCTECRAKSCSTHIIDQPNFMVEWKNPAAGDGDGSNNTSI
ncbi:hypothetical protein SUGI_0863130 [Cryptomeria japonica]|nr:hypothetical protein SUGI_0863130 [Cryptomeria japonica]